MIKTATLAIERRKPKDRKRSKLKQKSANMSAGKTYSRRRKSEKRLSLRSMKAYGGKRVKGGGDVGVEHRRIRVIWSSE